MTIPHAAELAILPVVTAGALIAMTFTPSEITALTVAAATLLGALFTGVALIITAIRSTRDRVDQSATKLAENTALTQAVQSKVDGVAVKVDGQASRAEEQIASLQTELKWLRERIGEQKQDAALLAQAKAAPTVTLPISATNVLNGSQESLTKISEDTDAIKHNTAKP